MFSNPLLDIAIGLIFLYLLLSIVLTVVQEFIASTLKLRNKNLQKAIIELLGEGNHRTFFSHPLIAPLFQGELDGEGRPKGGGPSYIPKRSFALAVLDLQGRADLARDPATGRLAPAFALAGFFDDDRSGVGLKQRVKRFDELAGSLIADIRDETVRTAATGALTAAVGEIKTSTDLVDTAVKELESLFDSTMDRAAGWYKVNAQRLAFVLGLGEGVAPDGEPASRLDQAGWRAVQECTRREIEQALGLVDEAGFPIGWTGWEGARPVGQPGQNMRVAPLGMLITGLALSLGASFWLDLLDKFMKVRMTGKREPTGGTASTGSEASGGSQ